MRDNVKVLCSSEGMPYQVYDARWNQNTAALSMFFWGQHA